ncbi:MAG: tetratricopeptide repeat protein, partial [Pseudomonadota bacterium]
MTNDIHFLSTSLARAAKLFAKEDFASALLQYRSLTKSYKKSADAWFGLACVLHAKRNVKEAEVAYRKVIRLGGSTVVSAWFNLGNLLRDQGFFNEAASAYQAAIVIDLGHAGAKFSLSQLALLRGDWLSGWAGYEFRRSIKGYPVADNKRFHKLMVRCQEWDGGVISGRRRLLVYSEQGAGDTIQFLRFVLRLKDRAQIILALPPVLLPLVEASPEFSELKCVSLMANMPAFDSHISLMSLPHRLGLIDEASLACTAYLKAPLDAYSRWRLALADASGLKVGLVWAGNPQHGNDSNRSMSLGQLSGLLACSGVTWISLQKELRVGDAELLLDLPALRRYGERLTDYGDTAGLIENLDLVISVDTSIVHLAGALGKPVWVMLPKVPDWRWLMTRESSPWYPMARLFRQFALGCWGGVLMQVQQALLSIKMPLPITKPPEINFNEVDAALEASQFDLAATLCDAIELTINADNPTGQGMLAFKRGCIALFLKQWSVAATYYRYAVVILPQLPEVHSNLALALGHLGHDTEAIAMYQIALKLRPGFIDAWRNLGRLHARYHRDIDALDCFHHLLNLRSNDSVVLKEIADCEQRMGRNAAAETHYLRALALRPAYAEAGLNYGRLLRNTDRLDAAENIWKGLLERDPTYSLARMNLAMLDMVRGHWKQGWVNYEARWLVDSMPEFNRTRRDELLARAPEWCGESLQGKTLLVYPEQGAGDTFQFLRFLPALRKRGAYVLLAATPNSQSLIEASGLCGANRLTTDSNDSIDFHVSLLSLPYRLGLDEPGLSMDNPYLQAPQASKASWSERLADAGGLKVGICWSGNPQHANDSNRSVELSVLDSLFVSQGITWVSLQRTLRSGEAECLAKLPQIRRYGELLDDFGDTAGLIANLDLVISVDTSVVHLAGALGKPVWILLSKVQDWRWLLERKDSPWYPTACLFRQRIAGHWSETVDQIKQALAVDSALATKQTGPNINSSAKPSIVVISATRLSKEDFWKQSALGLSLQRYVEQDISFSVRIAYENTRGLPEIFNDCINQVEDSAILVFVHDDVWINEVDFTKLVILGLECFDVIGVAGNRRRVPQQPNWIFSRLQGGRLFKDDRAHLSGFIAHGEAAPGTDSYFGYMPVECELLDGVFLAVKKSSLVQNNLRFDPQFDFHFYDMDFCRSVREAGLRLGTWPIKLIHQSKGG